MSPKSSRISISELAQKSGISISTVSRILSGDDSISSDTAEKFKNALAELGYTPNSLSRRLSILSENAESQILFAYSDSMSYPKLTPDLLSNVIAPYIEAINSLQNLVNEIEGIPSEDIQIREITQRSPISVSLDGAGGAIKSIEDIMVPWRRKHFENMANLEEHEKLVEIENKKAEILEKHASAAKDRAEAQKLLAEATKQRQEVESSKISTEKLKLELQREKINLALEVLNSLAPNLAQTEKVEYLIRLMKVIDVIGSSNFEIMTIK